MEVSSDRASRTLGDNRWQRSRLRSRRLARSAENSRAIAQTLRPLQRAYRRYMLANYSPREYVAQVDYNKLLCESLLAGELASSGSAEKQSGYGGEHTKPNGENHTDSIKAESRRHNWTWDKELESAQVSCGKQMSCRAHEEPLFVALNTDSNETLPINLRLQPIFAVLSIR